MEHFKDKKRTVSRFLVIIFTLGIFSNATAQSLCEPIDAFFGANVTSLITAQNGDVFAWSKSSGLHRFRKNDLRWELIDTGMRNGTGKFLMNKTGDLFLTVGQVYRSTDDGVNWQRLDISSRDILFLAVDRNNKLFAISDFNIFSSTDKGKTWNAAGSKPGFSGAPLAFNVNSKGYYYLSINFLEDKGGYILRSTDSGLNWERVWSGYLSGVYNISVNSKDFLFSEIMTYPNTRRLFRSTDDGQNWTTAIARGAPFISQSDELLAVTTEYGFSRSMDNGDTWNSTGALTFLPGNFTLDSSGTIYISGDNGVFLSRNNGQSWFLTKEGLRGQTIFRLAVDRTGHIFADADGDLYKSSDMGITWELTLSDISLNKILLVSTDIILLATDDGIFRTSNGGIDWMKVSNGSRRGWAMNAQGKIFAGYYKIITSVDSGKTWNAQTFVSGFPPDEITTLSINQKGYIFAGTVYEGIFRSTNDGASWERADNGLPYKPAIKLIAINSLGHLFASVDEGKGIYRSTDDGNLWTELSTGLSNASVNAIVINSLERIYIGTQSGEVLRSTDNGDTWTNIRSGLPKSLTVSSIALDKSENLLLGTTAGLYRSKTSTTPVIESSLQSTKGYVLGQNYPNPFSTITSIGLMLPTGSFVTLKIYDAFGREVETILSEFQSAGEYIVQWQNRNARSGVYFYQLRTEKFSLTGKMILRSE